MKVYVTYVYIGLSEYESERQLLKVFDDEDEALAFVEKCESQDEDDCDTSYGYCETTIRKQDFKSFKKRIERN